jgi:sugar lactone lactonase YvrE
MVYFGSLIRMMKKRTTRKNCIRIIMKKNLLIILIIFYSCRKNDQQDVLQAGRQSNNHCIVSTIAGDGSSLFEDGPALTAKFRAPQDVAVTTDGTVFIADALNHRIRKLVGGNVTTVAGFDKEDTTSGVGTAAGFAHPIQLAADDNGNIYTLDVSDFRVRKITPDAIVTVVAGSGVRGFADGRADVARFGESIGIVCDEAGNIYVSDNENKRIRKINNGQVTTIAGHGYVNGTKDQAEFFSLSGIVIDKQGNLFVADFDKIRKITPAGNVSTFAGRDLTGYRDGQPGDALFSFIDDMAMDGQGNIYVSDNNRIRKVSTTGEVTTVTGFIPGYRDGDGVSAEFNLVAGLGVDKQGNLYAADVNNNRIRKITFE